MTSATASKRAATRALLALAIGSFGIGMTEFVIMGLLPQISADLLPVLSASDPDAAIAQAGWLISLYALGVVIGAPTIAASVAKYPRHRVMFALAAALTLFNALTFVMPTFELVAVSRLLAGLPHGAYFGIGALVAADVLGPGSRAKGVAFVMAGLTVANVVGVPLGTLLGQQFGWRVAFAIVAGIFATTTVLIALFVPAHAGDPARTLRAELGAFRIGQVWFAIGVGAIGFGGFFAAYSYIAPVVTDVAGAPEWGVPIILIVMGVGMTVGNFVGGHLADVDLKRTLLGGFALFIVIQVLLALTAAWIVTLGIFVFALGAATSALAPTIQSRLMSVAGDNQSIAAALNHSALNIGNALGAFLGGLVIAHGLGFVAPIWVGLVLAVAGFGLALVSYAIEERTPTTVPV